MTKDTDTKLAGTAGTTAIAPATPTASSNPVQTPAAAAEGEDGKGGMTTSIKHQAATGGGEAASHPAPIEGPNTQASGTAAAIKGNPLSAEEKLEFGEYRKLIRTGLVDTFVRQREIGEALFQVKTKGLYRAEFKTFEEFCAREVNVARSRAYELMNAAQIQRDLSAMADKSVLPTNERQIRPLAVLKEPNERIEAWSKAVALAVGMRVTEAHVRKAVKRIKDRKKKQEVELEEPAPEIDAWKGSVINAFKEVGYEAAFEQPFSWSPDAVDLYSATGNRYVKIIDTLSVDEAACALTLKKIAPTSLIIVSGKKNSLDGYLDPTPGQMRTCFARSFNILMTQLDGYVEHEGNLYQATQGKTASDTTWTPITNPNLATLGLDQDETEAKTSTQ